VRFLLTKNPTVAALTTRNRGRALLRHGQVSGNPKDRSILVLPSRLSLGEVWCPDRPLGRRPIKAPGGGIGSHAPIGARQPTPRNARLLKKDHRSPTAGLKREAKLPNGREFPIPQPDFPAYRFPTPSTEAAEKVDELFMSSPERINVNPARLVEGEGGVCCSNWRSIGKDIAK
jgi:hypothetical protein